MKICVIGAGPSGLTTIKQLLDEGHDVLCFEKDEDIGGIWRQHVGDESQMKVFDSLMLTISMKLMAFSDFIHEGERTFTDHRGYLQYLRNYHQKFKLGDSIQLRTNVDSVNYEGGLWKVKVSGPEGAAEHTFEALAICTGPFQQPNDQIAELEGFTGAVTHSAHYRRAEDFRGKKVLVVGLAESGADVVREVAEVAQSCTLAIRSRTFLLPRLFFGKYSTDMLTFRSHHYEDWVRATKRDCPQGTLLGESRISRAIFLVFAAVYGFITLVYTLLAWPFRRTKVDAETLNNLGQPMLPYKLDVSVENSKENVDAINEWNDRSHDRKGNWTQRKIFCKNVGFIPGIVSGKIEVNDSGLESAQGQTVQFKDAKAQAFDAVVLCTGFVKSIPMLGDIAVDNVRDLYKLAFHPDYEGRLAIIGFIRPHSGGIPVCAEMQARYFAAMCAGKVEFPADVKQRIAREKAWIDARTNLSPRNHEAIPSQILYMDAIAREIGCLIPTRTLLFRPRLFVKLWFCAFNQASYRMVGPHSDPENARREIMGEKLPGESLRFLILTTVLSFLPHSIHPKNLDVTLD